MSVFAATELWRLSELELAEAIRSRQVSVREVVEAHLRRIDAVDPAVNALPVVLAEEALAAATAADRKLAAREALPRLHGVPFVVKSNIDVKGTPTTQGIRAFADAYPQLDAPIVERMKQAGAIVIGRTNMPSLAVRWHCESELYGPTANPWDPSRTAGGSSAAVAVAVATGMSPCGLGNDGLGSLRHPAQCCGITALKPTFGRVPQDSTSPGGDVVSIGAELVSVNGPMARRVADLRVAFEVIAGSTWRDPWSVPAALQGPAVVPPIRVALVADPAGQGTAVQVRDGVLKAARALEEAGYLVDDVEPPSIQLAAKVCLDMLNTPDVQALWAAASALMPPGARNFLAQFYQYAGAQDPIAAMNAFAVRRSLIRSWGEFQETHPLILAPVCTEPPFRAGTDLTERRVGEEIESMRMVAPVNALGLPAVALPVGVADGLPQAVQIIGPRYREDLCLDAAAAVEGRLGTFTPIDPRAARPRNERH
jgi:amidase